MSRRHGVPGRRAHTSLGHAADVGSDGEDAQAAESMFSPPATSSLPYIKTFSRQNERSVLSQKVKQGVLDPTQYHIYAENYGGVEFYRKMARKAESAAQMEHKQFQSDLDRSNDLITRLRARVSALEALADEKEVLLENQKRKTRQYKRQLLYNNKAYEKDMAYMRAQVEISEKRLAEYTEETRRKLLDLRHDNAKKVSSLEMLQNDMVEIHKSIDEPLDSFYLPDYFAHRIDSRLGPVRKSEGMKTAAKILRIRVDLDDLMQERKAKNKELSSLQDETKSLRKGTEELSKFRDTAINSLKALDDVSHRLNGLDRNLGSAMLLKGVDFSASAGDESQDKISNGFNRVQEKINLLVSKADAANRTANSVQYEHDKCGSLTAQIREDLGLEKIDVKADDLSANLAIVREQVRRRLETLNMLQKEKSSVEAAVTKNVSKARELERSLDELTNKQRRLKIEKDKLAETLLLVQKDKAAATKHLHRLQDLFIRLGSTLEDGNFDSLRSSGTPAIKSSTFDEQKEVGRIVGSLETLTTDKNRLESKLKKANSYITELLSIFQMPEKGADAIAELPLIVPRVVKLKSDCETITARLKAAETELSDLGNQKDTQLDLTLRATSDACSSLQGSVSKMQPVFGEGDRGNAKLASGLAELKQVTDEVSVLVPKILALKKEKDSIAAKLEGTTKQGDSVATKLDAMIKDRDAAVLKIDGMTKERDGLVTKMEALTKERDALVTKVDALTKDREALTKDRDSTLVKLDGLSKERETLASKLDQTGHKLAAIEKRGSGISQSAVKHLETIRENLKAIQALFPAVLGKNFGTSLSDDVALLDRIRQELLSANETKDRALVRAQTLSAQASQLDPILTELSAAILSIHVDVGGTPFREPGSGYDAAGRLSFMKDRLIEVKAALTGRVKNASDEVGDLREKVKLQESVLKNSEKKWSERMELAKKEILRLGGCDLDNKAEASKRLQAQARTKEFVLRSKQHDAAINPLSKLAAFQVQLLVNNKVHGDLQIGGTAGGLFQAAVHYFRIESQSGDVTFENATVPGSQSSNMLVELLLNSGGNTPIYESKGGDVLGLSVKVKSVDEQEFREILYNSNVIQTDEVMEAIKGQTLDNFSLWPDLVSSWKWERIPTKGWTLMTIKWRFLLKSIFPELSEPLQALAIANRPAYDRTQTIRTL